jgi:hypothetical protein
MAGDVAVADIDGDGHLDIVTGMGNDASPGHMHVFFGPFIDGKASDVWSSTMTDYYRRVAVGDINGDRCLDIAVAIMPPINGDAGVAQSTGSVPDAMLDAWTSGQQAVAVYRNTCAASASKKKGRDLGAYPSQAFVIRSASLGAGVSPPVTALSVALGDYDSDGDLDLAVGGGNFSYNITMPIFVLTNESGTFQPSAPTTGWRSSSPTVSFSVRFLDLDSDGSVDLLTTGIPDGSAPNWGTWFRGTGTTLIKEGTALTAQGMPDVDIIATDMIGEDGGTVVVAALNARGFTGPRPGQGLQDGLGWAALVQQQAIATSIQSQPHLATDVQFADLDGDGQVDLLWPTWAPGSPLGDRGPLFCGGHVRASGGPADAQTLGPAKTVFYTEGLAVGDLAHDLGTLTTTDYRPPSCSGSRGHVVTLPMPNVQEVVKVVGANVPSFAAPPDSRLVYVNGGYPCGNPPLISYKSSNSIDIVLVDGVVPGRPVDNMPVKIFWSDK